MKRGLGNLYSDIPFLSYIMSYYNIYAEFVISRVSLIETILFSLSTSEIPDILDGRNLKFFKAWDGHQKYISNIKMRRIVRTSSTVSNPHIPSSSQSSKNNDQGETSDLVSDEGNELHDDGDNDEDDDEGVEDDILDSDVEDRNADFHESMNDEGVDSH